MTTIAVPTPNPAIISWARQDSGYTPEHMAQRLQVKSAQVITWEQGTQKPTLKQIEKLAAFFRRPLSPKSSSEAEPKTAVVRTMK